MKITGGWWCSKVVRNSRQSGANTTVVHDKIETVQFAPNLRIHQNQNIKLLLLNTFWKTNKNYEKVVHCLSKLPEFTKQTNLSLHNESIKFRCYKIYIYIYIYIHTHIKLEMPRNCLPETRLCKVVDNVWETKHRGQMSTKV